ncbi:MAG TPA: SPOR domain-containing protein [Candidatus Eisenbacteria bacterium]|nr:SPOR domain-containing protein [Candidatus Eisenbacteria bacterium]
MAEPKQQETQQELFSFSPQDKPAERLPAIPKNQKPILFSTSMEHIILAAILGILAACVIFFLGVVRGKSLTAYAPPGAAAAQTARPSAPAPAAIRVSQPSQTVRPSGQGPAVSPAQPVNPATVAAPAPAAADSAKPYTIQLVTYKKRDLAEKEVAALRRSGYWSIVIPSGDYYQVCVGQYASMEDAKKDLRIFGTRYKDRFLRRR